jgi:hypothetical protein
MASKKAPGHLVDKYYWVDLDTLLTNSLWLSVCACAELCDSPHANSVPFSELSCTHSQLCGISTHSSKSLASTASTTGLVQNSATNLSAAQPPEGISSNERLWEGSPGTAQPRERAAAAPTEHAQRANSPEALSGLQNCRNCGRAAGCSQTDSTGRATNNTPERELPERRSATYAPCPGPPEVPALMGHNPSIVDCVGLVCDKNCQELGKVASCESLSPMEQRVPSKPGLREQPTQEHSNFEVKDVHEHQIPRSRTCKRRVLAVCRSSQFEKAAVAEPDTDDINGNAHPSDPDSWQATDVAASQADTYTDDAACHPGHTQQSHGLVSISVQHGHSIPMADLAKEAELQQVLELHSATSNGLEAGYEASLDTSQTGNSHVSTTALSRAMRLSSNLSIVVEDPLASQNSAKVTQNKADVMHVGVGLAVQSHAVVEDAEKIPELADVGSIKDTADSGTLSTHRCDPSDMRCRVLALGSAPVEAICSRPSIGTDHDKQKNSTLALSEQMSNGSSSDGGRVLVGCITAAPQMFEALAAGSTISTKGGYLKGNMLMHPLGNIQAGCSPSGGKASLHDEPCAADDDSAHITSALLPVENGSSPTPTYTPMSTDGFQLSVGRSCKIGMLPSSFEAHHADNIQFRASDSPTPTPRSLRARYSVCSSGPNSSAALSAAIECSRRCSSSWTCASKNELQDRVVTADGNTVVAIGDIGNQGIAKTWSRGIDTSDCGPVKWESLGQAWKIRKACSPGCCVDLHNSIRNQSIGKPSQDFSSIDQDRDCQHTDPRVTEFQPMVDCSLGNDRSASVVQGDLHKDLSLESQTHAAGPSMPPERDCLGSDDYLALSAAAARQMRPKRQDQLAISAVSPGCEGYLADCKKSSKHGGPTTEKSPVKSASTQNSLLGKCLPPADSTLSMEKKCQKAETHPVSSALPAADKSGPAQESTAQVAWLTASTDTAAGGATSQPSPLNLSAVGIFPTPCELCAENDCSTQLQGTVSDLRNVAQPRSSPTTTDTLAHNQKLCDSQVYELRHAGTDITLPSMPSEYTIDSNAGVATQLGPMPTPRVQHATMPRKQTAAPRSQKSNASDISSHAVMDPAMAPPPTSLDRSTQRRGQGPVQPCPDISHLERVASKTPLKQMSLGPRLPGAKRSSCTQHLAEVDCAFMKMGPPSRAACAASKVRL